MKCGSYRRLCGALAAVLLAFSLVGCGGGGKHPVKGMVLLNNQPVTNGRGTVAFELMNPQQGQIPAARAMVMSDGSYVLMTEEVGDGAVPGRYRVTVQLQEMPPKGDTGGETMPSLIPRKYADPAKSGLEFTIPDDISPDGTIDLLLEGEGES